MSYSSSDFVCDVEQWFTQAGIVKADDLPEDDLGAFAEALVEGFNARLDERDAMILLLTRAAGMLQDYCSAAGGDMNDNLAMEIKKLLDGLK